MHPQKVERLSFSTEKLFRLKMYLTGKNGRACAIIKFVGYGKKCGLRNNICNKYHKQKIKTVVVARASQSNCNLI